MKTKTYIVQKDMVGIICERDGVLLNDYEQARKKIEEAIQVVGAYTKTHKRVSAYRMFRSAGTKDALRTFQPAKQIELPFEEEDAA